MKPIHRVSWGVAMGNNWGQSDAVRLAAWESQGCSDEEAQKLLAAGITGENGPARVDADGTPVYWWEGADLAHIQALNSIQRMKFNRADHEPATLCVQSQGNS